ncbi:hypothetical protein PPACK8108_LOCUS8526 [Phakopsora pachyrhizi]|uniref:Uncharacterized protein n=1 Tax=Phakopsora pachyrhizi TaxID=170000 RepID=A0AAV0AY37_PHAPC|nr:hypothetical protein PPACK8108_LOCUS8526 [Phakopsora pachyrhizi]
MKLNYLRDVEAYCDKQEIDRRSLIQVDCYRLGVQERGFNAQNYGIKLPNYVYQRQREIWLQTGVLTIESSATERDCSRNNRGYRIDWSLAITCDSTRCKNYEHRREHGSWRSYRWTLIGVLGLQAMKEFSLEQQQQWTESQISSRFNNDDEILTTDDYSSGDGGDWIGKDDNDKDVRVDELSERIISELKASNGGLLRHSNLAVSYINQSSNLRLMFKRVSPSNNPYDELYEGLADSFESNGQ